MYNNLKINNVRLPGDSSLYSLSIKNGIIDSIEALDTTMADKSSDTHTLDAEGGLVLPPFVDSHIHYDSAYTAGEPRWNKSGTLLEGIQCNNERQGSATESDYLTRAKKAIQGQVLNGVQYSRVHVDVSQVSLLALKVMLKLKEDLKHLINIQVFAFPQMGITSHPKQYELLESAIKLGVDGIGGVPHQISIAMKLMMSSLVLLKLLRLKLLLEIWGLLLLLAI